MYRDDAFGLCILAGGKQLISFSWGLLLRFSACPHHSVPDGGRHVVRPRKTISLLVLVSAVLGLPVGRREKFLCRTCRLTFATRDIRLEGCVRACRGLAPRRGPKGWCCLNYLWGWGPWRYCTCTCALYRAATPPPTSDLLSLHSAGLRSLCCFQASSGTSIQHAALWGCTVSLSAMGLKMQFDRREQPWAAAEHSSSAHGNCSKTKFCLKGACESS